MKRYFKRSTYSSAFSNGFVSQMRNADFLNSRLPAEPKNRLVTFRRNLAITRGLDTRNFDSDLIDLVKTYALDPKKVNEELDYLYHLKDDNGYPFSRNLKIYSSVEGAMKRFAEDNHPYFGWNNHYKAAISRLRREMSEAYLSPLHYENDSDIINAIPKLTTHSGFTFIESGVKKKGDNLENIYQKYHNKENEAISNGTFNRPLLVGFRTQASGEYDDDGIRTHTCKHKLRVISMVDLYVIIAELKFAQPLQRYLSKKGFYAGGKDESEIGMIITDNRVKYNRYYSIDYSSFDQTLSNWLIHDAFMLLKELFRKSFSSLDNQLFNVIVHDFINKTFVCSEGDVISHKGVPSGSMFTQIIDSICNLIMIYTYLDYINVDGRCIVMGDDNLFFLPDSHGEERLDELSSYLNHMFGVIINTDKSSFGSTLQDPEFLSRYWTKFGRWRHPNQLLSRLAYPERYRSYNSEVTPAHVLLAFVLSYNFGMSRLINVPKFRNDYPISSVGLFDNVDSRYLPGVLAYMREYG